MKHVYLLELIEIPPTPLQTFRLIEHYGGGIIYFEIGSICFLMNDHYQNCDGKRKTVLVL